MLPNRMDFDSWCNEQGYGEGVVLLDCTSGNDMPIGLDPENDFLTLNGSREHTFRTTKDYTVNSANFWNAGTGDHIKVDYWDDLMNNAEYCSYARKVL